MKIILKEDISNLGFSGDVKNVKNGYARNYLIPNNLVISANAKTKKHYTFLQEMKERKILKKRKQAEQLASQLENENFTITAKIGKDNKMFGSITSIHIHKALQEKKFDIHRKMILLDQPIKVLGDFKINLQIYEKITTSITLTIQDETGNKVMPEPIEEPKIEPISPNLEGENAEENAISNDTQDSQETTIETE